MLGFFIGASIGATIGLFVAGATRTNKENEIYMEGFNAGKADKLENEIRLLEAEKHKSAQAEIKYTGISDESRLISVGEFWAYHMAIEILKRGHGKEQE